MARLVPSKPVYNRTRGACPTNSPFQAACHWRSCRRVELQGKEQRLMFTQKKRKNKNPKAAIGVSRCLPRGTHPHKSFKFPGGLSRNQVTAATSDPSTSILVSGHLLQLLIILAKLYLSMGLFSKLCSVVADGWDWGVVELDDARKPLPHTVLGVQPPLHRVPG